MSYILPEDGYDSYLSAALGSSDVIAYVNALPRRSAGVLTIFDVDSRTIKEKIYYTGTAGDGSSTDPYRLTGLARGVRLTPSSGVILFTSDSTLVTSHGTNRRIAMTDNINYIGVALAVLNGDMEMGGVMQLPATRSIDSARDVTDKEYVDSVASAAGGISAFLVTQNGADPSLTINVGAGYLIAGQEVISYAGSSAQAVTPSTTNYVMIDWNGTLLINTTGFAEGYCPLAEVVTSGTDITSITDRRSWLTNNGAIDKLVTDRFTYGATIAANDPLYYDSASGKVKKALATAAATADTFVGVAVDAGVDTNTNMRVQFSGRVTLGSAVLTAGAPVYLTDAGGFSGTAGTYRMAVGRAVSTTQFYLFPPRRVNELTGVNSDGTVANLNTALSSAALGGYLYSFTNGESFTIPSGYVVCVKSDGNIELPKLSAFSTAQSTVSIATIGSSVAARQSNGKCKMFRKTALRGAVFVMNWAGTPVIRCDMYTIVPGNAATPSSFDSANGANATGGYADDGATWDAVQLTKSTVLVVYPRSGTGDLGAAVWTLTDSGAPTVASVVTMVTAANYDNAKGVRLVRLSSTKVALFVFKTGTGIQAYVITVSGTTPSVGSATTVVSSANALEVRGACEFTATTDPYYMALWYVDTTATTSNIIGVSLNGTTYATGTGQSVSSANGRGELVCKDATTALWVYTHTDSSVTLRSISASGTTLTLNATQSVTASAAVASCAASITALGPYTYGLSYPISADGVRYLLYSCYATTPALIGSATDITADKAESCGRIIEYQPGVLTLVYNNYDSGASDDNWKMVNYLATNNFDKAFGVTNAAIASAAAGNVAVGPRMGTIVAFPWYAPNVADTALTPGDTLYADIDGALWGGSETEPVESHLRTTAVATTAIMKRN